MKVPTAGGVFRGITVRDVSLDAQRADKYAEKDIASVVTKGVITVSVAVTVAAGAPVYFVPATGVITNVSTSNTLIANAMFDSSGTGLVDLRLA